MYYVEINLVYQEELTENQRQFLLYNENMFGNCFVKITDGDPSAVRQIDTSKILSVEEVAKIPEAIIVTEIGSENYLYCKSLGMAQRKGFWYQETEFYYEV